MDQRSGRQTPVKVNILGFGFVGPQCLITNCDSIETTMDARAHLKEKKALKFMAKQDQLALEAATKSVKMAKLSVKQLD